MDYSQRPTEKKNSMPRETIQIRAYGKDPEAPAVAQLMSYVAYPHADDGLARLLFARSLYRMALLWRADTDKGWADSFQPVYPSVFQDEDKVFLASLKRGMTILGRHLVTADTFLMPHLIGLSTGKAAPPLDRLHPTLQGSDAMKAPTVENMSMIVMQALGWNGDSSSTVKSRLWAEVKPVAHVGHTIATWLRIEANSANLDPSEVFFYLFFKGMLLAYIGMSELCRKKLPSIKQFKINESDTIKFVAV